MRKQFNMLLILWALCALPATARAAPGDFLWTGNIGGNSSTWSTPVVYGSLLIVNGQHGGLTAFNNATGSQAWYNADIVASVTSPIVFQNMLYLGVDTHLYKITPSTGTVVLDRTLAGSVSANAPAALDNLLYFVTNNAGDYLVHAADITTLEDVWTFPLPTAGTVLTDGTNLYVLADQFYALNPQTGTIRWAVSPPAPYNYFEYGAVYNGYLAAFAHSQFDGNTILACYTIGNGSVAPSLAWSQGFGMVYADGSPPAIDGSRVFANSRGGILRAFDLATGTELWSYTVRGLGQASALPVALDGKVYVQLFVDTPAMLCLDGATGAEVWKNQTSMGVAWSQPVVADGRVYLATDWAGIYAFATQVHTHAWPMYKNNTAQTSASVTTAYTSSPSSLLMLLLNTSNE